MFKSITFKRYDSKTGQYFYDLEDTEFGIVEVYAEPDDFFGIKCELAIVNEYAKRNLDVSKNIAIYTIWLYENEHIKIDNLVKLQDEKCAGHIPNWKEYAQSRDEYLAKFLLIG